METIKNFSAVSFRANSVKRSTYELHLANSLVLLPQIASNVKKAMCAICSTYTGSELPPELVTSRALLRETIFVRRNKKRISARQWLDDEISEFHQARAAYESAKARGINIVIAEREMQLEFIDCIGLLAHTWGQKQWLAADNERDLYDRDCLVAALAETLLSMHGGRLSSTWPKLLASLTPDIYASWYDDKVSKGYDMSEAWVADLYVLLAAISLIPAVKSDRW